MLGFAVPQFGKSASHARLGSSVLVAPWYPPIQLARRLSCIDVISGDPLLSGFGIGYLERVERLLAR